MLACDLDVTVAGPAFDRVARQECERTIGGFMNRMRGVSMSRRDFLQLAGAVGGSAAVHRAAMGLGLLPAVAAARPQTAPAGSKPLKIIILGAGISGLTAAYSQFFDTPEQPNLPSRSTVQVAGLVTPGMLVEIEVTLAR